MPERPRASILEAARAVIWSFLGIRRRSGHESDVGRLSLRQVVIAGLIGAAVFVLVLIVVVRLVIRYAGV